MTEARMSTAPQGYRLLQVFLCVDNGEPSVQEVSWHHVTNDLHCTCGKRKCKHQLWVSVKMSGGKYVIPRPRKAPDLTAETVNDPLAYREYILRWGQIETLQ